MVYVGSLKFKQLLESIYKSITYQTAKNWRVIVPRQRKRKTPMSDQENVFTGYKNTIHIKKAPTSYLNW